MVELVGDREVQALLLGAVAQGRVVDVEVVARARLGIHLVPSWSLGLVVVVVVVVVKSKRPLVGTRGLRVGGMPTR